MSLSNLQFDNDNNLLKYIKNFMSYKKFIYLITLSSHIFNFTGGVASRALNNPNAQKRYKDMSPAEKLELAKKCANNRISAEIECKGIPLSEVSSKLDTILNYPLYNNHLDKVVVYGTEFDKHFLKGGKAEKNTVRWVPSKVPTVANNTNKSSDKRIPYEIIGSIDDPGFQKIAKRIGDYMAQATLLARIQASNTKSSGKRRNRED